MIKVGVVLPSDPCRLHLSRSPGGFTLVEALVAMIAMGLSITGILNLFQWGNMRYLSVNRSARYQGAVLSIRRHLRMAISRNELSALSREELEKAVELPERFRIAETSLKSYGKEGVFVSFTLFEDRNGNGVSEESELFQPTLVCFRIRSGHDQK